jgi:hypothetical protein
MSKRKRSNSVEIIGEEVEEKIQKLDHNDWTYIDLEYSKMFTDMTIYFEDSKLAIKVHSQYMIINSKHIEGVFTLNDNKIEDITVSEGIFKGLTSFHVDRFFTMIYYPKTFSLTLLRFNDLRMIWNMVDYFSNKESDELINKLIISENFLEYDKKSYSLEKFFKIIQFCQKRKLHSFGKKWFDGLMKELYKNIEFSTFTDLLKIYASKDTISFILHKFMVSERQICNIHESSRRDKCTALEYKDLYADRYNFYKKPLRYEDFTLLVN